MADDLTDETVELCEKIILFAYSGFSSENIFHVSLLVSVFHLLQKICDNKDQWTDVGFSSNNPYEDDLNHDMAALGLFLIMFLDKYIPRTLEEMMRFSLENNISFVALAFDITEIVVVALRRRKLNKLMIESQKCLEVIFFLYAGCMASWFNVFREENRKHGEINAIVEKYAFDHTKVQIDLAVLQLKNQNTSN